MSGKDMDKDTVKSEVEGLATAIAKVRQDLAALGAAEIQGKHIPTATDELDAIIGATEDASGTIMDSCEAIQKTLGGVDDAKSIEVLTEVTKIFEACSFQDITGQRISKVIKAIKAIEGHVNKIMVEMGIDISDIELADEQEDPMSDAALLNGPQMNDDAISQEDIDKMMEG